MCKYGDFFLALEMAEGKGIVNVAPLSVYNTERLENTDPENPNYVNIITEDVDDAINSAYNTPPPKKHPKNGEHMWNNTPEEK